MMLPVQLWRWQTAVTLPLCWCSTWRQKHFNILNFIVYINVLPENQSFEMLPSNKCQLLKSNISRGGLWTSPSIRITTRNISWGSVAEWHWPNGLFLSQDLLYVLLGSREERVQESHSSSLEQDHRLPSRYTVDPPDIRRHLERKSTHRRQEWACVVSLINGGNYDIWHWLLYIVWRILRLSDFLKSFVCVCVCPTTT